MISIAISVLQYHLYDVRVVIRRIVVYGGLTVALTTVFVGVYFAVLAALSGQLVAVRYRWVAVVAATVAVLAAEPVRRRIQIRLERRFLGERGDPLGVLARLHAALSDGNEDENTVYATITRTVATAVRSPAVALALQRGPQIETVSVTGAEQDAALVLPLVYRGERIGEMRVSTRTPGEPYGRATGHYSTSLPTRPPHWSTHYAGTPSCRRCADEPWRPWQRSALGWAATCMMASPRCWPAPD